MQVKAFNRWDCSDIAVHDPGLKRYINLEPRIVPKTGSRDAQRRFRNGDVFIVERLINKVMNPGHKGDSHLITSGHITGKATSAYEIVENALEKIEQELDQNPIEVLVRAIENAAARDEIITIEYAGARYPKAVEMAPKRRVDLTLRLFTQGAYQDSFRSEQDIEDALAQEIMDAYHEERDSNAYSKGQELERQADSSR